MVLFLVGSLNGDRWWLKFLMGFSILSVLITGVEFFLTG